MIDVYSWPTPNGNKIHIMLEECGLREGRDWQAIAVNIGQGDQFKPDFLKLSPNGKIPAILDRAPADGGAPISASAAVYLLERLRGAAPGTPGVAAPDAERLTPREIELLELFSRGQSYKLASRALGISPLTVGNHVKSIYRKLQVHSRGEAVYEAVRRKQLSL